MSFAEKQACITRQLAALPDGQERLAWLIERAGQSPPFPLAARVEQNLVPGCLARLWLVAEERAGCCHFACDSDSRVVKAIAGLLCDLYSGETPAEILAHDPQFLAPLGITQHLTPNRRNALAKVWDHIRQFAAKAGQA